jgi:MFS family permease
LCSRQLHQARLGPAKAISTLQGICNSFAPFATARITPPAADIVFVSNIAPLMEEWFIEYLSWRWIFWASAFFCPVMMVCVYYGIRAKNPSSQGPAAHNRHCTRCQHVPAIGLRNSLVS